MEHLSKSTIPVTLNVYVVKIFSNTMFLLIVLQEENPLSIAKFYTIAKSFSTFYFFSFLVVSLLLLFFHFAKWKEKVFWWYDSEIRYARKLIYLKYETVQLVFTCSKSTKETLEGGGKHVHKKIKNYVTWLHVILVFSYIGTHFSPCVVIVWLTLRW